MGVSRGWPNPTWPYVTRLPRTFQILTEITSIDHKKPLLFCLDSLIYRNDLLALPSENALIILGDSLMTCLEHYEQEFVGKFHVAGNSTSWIILTPVHAMLIYQPTCFLMWFFSFDCLTLPISFHPFLMLLTYWYCRFTTSKVRWGNKIDINFNNEISNQVLYGYSDYQIGEYTDFSTDYLVFQS